MRTPLTYYGGKQRLADRIVALMPPHQVYLEPYCGGAAVFFAKPRARRETINDLDGAVAAFWRACRDNSQALATAVELTPYSREEWRACWEGLSDTEASDVELGRRLVAAIDQSYSRSGNSWSPPSLLAERRGRWQPGTWENVPSKIVAVADRLKGVAVENADAAELIPKWDLPNTLIYCDPPYTGEHRINRPGPGGQGGYRKCYRLDDHPDLWPDLTTALLAVEKADVILSGYPCEETELLVEAGWTVRSWEARRTSQTRLNTPGTIAPETVWLSPSIEAATRLSLLDEVV